MRRTRLISKVVIADICDDVLYCPVCHRLITQHIITTNWKDLGICSCGWTSGQKTGIRHHQSKFYKIVPSIERKEYLKLVETFPHY